MNHLEERFLSRQSARQMFQEGQRQRSCKQRSGLSPTEQGQLPRRPRLASAHTRAGAHSRRGGLRTKGLGAASGMGSGGRYAARRIRRRSRGVLCGRRTRGQPSRLEAVLSHLRRQLLPVRPGMPAATFDQLLVPCFSTSSRSSRSSCARGGSGVILPPALRAYEDLSRERDVRQRGPTNSSRRTSACHVPFRDSESCDAEPSASSDAMISAARRRRWPCRLLRPFGLAQNQARRPAALIKLCASNNNSVTMVLLSTGGLLCPFPFAP